VQLAPPSSADFERAANLPGRIMLFGHIAISEEESRRSQTLGGSNIVGYARDDAPWVTHFQLVELTNNPIVVHPMRQYEPFFLTPDELGQHGHWLWGGALHVFQSRQIELTRDVLVEWFARLMPGSR
jgi:hypothetical protein